MLLTATSAAGTLGGLPGVARVPQHGVGGFTRLLDSASRQDLMLIGEA